MVSEFRWLTKASVGDARLGQTPDAADGEISRRLGFPGAAGGGGGDGATRYGAVMWGAVTRRPMARRK